MAIAGGDVGGVPRSKTQDWRPLAFAGGGDVAGDRWWLATAGDAAAGGDAGRGWWLRSASRW